MQEKILILGILDDIKDRLKESRILLNNSEKFSKGHNTVFVTPHIPVEYERFLKNENISFGDFIKMYQTWVCELELSILANNHNLPSKVLYNHLDKSLTICENLNGFIRQGLSKTGI